MKQTATHTLLVPVEPDGKCYTELTFRRMKARDTLVSEDNDSQIMAGYLMFAAMADVPVDVILELDMDDLDAVGEIVTPLMGKQAVARMALARAEAAKAGAN